MNQIIENVSLLVQKPYADSLYCIENWVKFIKRTNRGRELLDAGWKYLGIDPPRKEYKGTRRRKIVDGPIYDLRI